MRKIGLTSNEKTNLQSLLRSEVVAVDVPDETLSSGTFATGIISTVRITFHSDKHAFFGVRSVDLVEGVEVFLLDITTFSDIRRYPGGPEITWCPLVGVESKMKGSTIEGIRILSAEWQIVSDITTKGRFYGKDPVLLAYDFSDHKATYCVDDGVILFLSDGNAFTISATGDLSGTLKLWHSKA